MFPPFARVSPPAAALVFDITPPIICGVPTCSRLELQGDPVESGELTVLWSYTGGQESGSTFQWTRISSTGKETALQVRGGRGHPAEGTAFM